MSSTGNDQHVYWEEQVVGLCAVHALNSLLQGPYIGAFDLAPIAQTLFDEERQMLSNGEHLVENPHVDNAGNFSIEVIFKVLSAFGLDCARVGSSEAPKDVLESPATQKGFLCHLDNHWLAIRKIGERWFNLNSLLVDGPAYVSDFYLSAFLNQLRSEGYTIFVIQARKSTSKQGEDEKGSTKQDSSPSPTQTDGSSTPSDGSKSTESKTPQQNDGWPPRLFSHVDIGNWFRVDDIIRRKGRKRVLSGRELGESEILAKVMIESMKDVKHTPNEKNRKENGGDGCRDSHYEDGGDSGSSTSSKQQQEEDMTPQDTPALLYDTGGMAMDEIDRAEEDLIFQAMLQSLQEQ